MGDPLDEQTETMAALRQVVEAAGPYLEQLPERLVYDQTAEPLLGSWVGRYRIRAWAPRPPLSGWCGSAQRPRPLRPGRDSSIS